MRHRFPSLVTGHSLSLNMHTDTIVYLKMYPSVLCFVLLFILLSVVKYKLEVEVVRCTIQYCTLRYDKGTGAGTGIGNL